jgi:CheY-like chemotaxis protein
MSNAIKFTPRGKNIIVSASYKNNKLSVIVADEGIGLSKDVQKKIFEPFKQADNSTTRKYGGTGLGLSIVLNLVEQMNGEIKIDSIEGKGSKFEIVLFIEKVNYMQSKLKELDKIIKNKLNGHILVAEDNKTNQMLIGILLEELGLSYETVDDGIQAVEKFDNDKFDVVLMDENMPNLNGTEAMKEIRKLHGNKVPIIALTANAMSGDKEKFLAAGMDGYISKPIDDDKLYNMLKSFLNS